MLKQTIVAILILGSAITIHSKANDICYDKLGCFSRKSPISSTGLLPETPEKINTNFLVHSKDDSRIVTIGFKHLDLWYPPDLDANSNVAFVSHGYGGQDSSWAKGLINALKSHNELVIYVDWSGGSR